MNRKPISNDFGRIKFLQQAMSAAQEDLAQGIVYLEEGLIQEAGATVDAFEAALTAKKASQEAVWVAQRARRDAVEALRADLASYWEAARRRAKREGYSELAYIFYGLRRNGNNHPIRTQVQVIQRAEQTIAQADKLVGQGYQPLQDPSSVMLQTKLEEAQLAFGAVEQAQRLRNGHQQTLTQTRQATNEMIREVLSALRYQLRHFAPVEQRQIMRTYGVQYEPDYEKVPPATDETGEPAVDVGLVSPEPIENITYSGAGNPHLSNDEVLAAVNGEGQLEDEGEQAEAGS